jgi:Invasion associated locus B (IalB) protein
MNSRGDATMQVLRTVLIAVNAAMITGGAFAADATKTLGDFGAWQAYSYSEGGAKVCYATAAADRTQGGDKGRKPTYVAVTHRQKSTNEVSLIGGYGFKKDVDAEIQIGTAKYAFFTKGDSAWSKQPSADKAIIAGLSKGKDLIIHATPAKGHPVVDTVSLSGFGKALAAIDKACGVKR